MKCFWYNWCRSNFLARIWLWFHFCSAQKQAHPPVVYILPFRLIRHCHLKGKLFKIYIRFLWLSNNFKVYFFKPFRFRSNIKNLSRLMRLQQSGKHPMDESIWLLEFLSKTSGAEHLKLESRNLNFIQYNCIDVMIFLIFTVYLVSKCLKLFCCKAKTKTKTEWNEQSH